MVAAMVRHDPSGLEQAYRRYAAPLLAYSRALLADPHAAADIVHDTFVLASSHVRQLRDPDLLRPWLYAIARNECRRAVRARGRTATLDAAVGLAAGDLTAGCAGDDPATGYVGGDPAARFWVGDSGAGCSDGGLGFGCSGGDAGRGLAGGSWRAGEPDRETAGRAGELVRAAVAGLSAGDRTVIELALRHDLSAVQVGAALGLATNHAHARLSRARAQLRRALAVLLIARAQGAVCPALRRVLGQWHGRLTPLLRKRVDRHVDGCAACRAQRQRPLTAAAVLTASAELADVATALPADWRRPRAGKAPCLPGTGRPR